MRFKLLKPDWAKRTLDSGETNPGFVKEIPGEKTLEGDFTPEFLQDRNEEGYNIYFFPNFPTNLPSEIKYARGEHIDNFGVIFVDMDLKDGVYKSKDEFINVLKNFPLPPTSVVDSGHGIHAYWEISDLTRNDFVTFQLRLIQLFKTDDSIWTVKQVMRFPGYKNTKKYGEFIDCIYMEGFNPDNIYTLAQIDEYLPDITDDNKTRAIRHLNKMDGLESEVDLDDMDGTIPDRFLKVLNTNQMVRSLWEDPKGYQGDRSSADMKLANELFNLDFDKTEAFRILMNTEKSRSRDPHARQAYAFSTVDKVYSDRPKNGDDLKPLSDYNEAEEAEGMGSLVGGPEWMDCQKEKWRTKQVLGLVLGTGVGKTTLSLKIIEEILKNNPKGRFIFYSLEMTKAEIAHRWRNLTRNNPSLSKRFHVVANENKSNDIRHLGLQEIVWITRDIKKVTGDQVIGICIDHMGEVSNVVDTQRSPSFNAIGDVGGGHGRYRTLGYPNLCSKVKDIAKTLDVFVIMQSQTRREYDRKGDVPIYKDGAKNTSNFEQMVHWMVSGWQPLMRVHTETELRVTAWQYCKLRNAKTADKVQVNDPRLLNFDMDTGNFRLLTSEEHIEFNKLNAMAEERRLEDEKKKGTGIVYKNSPGQLLRLVELYDQKKNNGSI